MSAPRPTVVVLGMMTSMPVAGVIWQTLHYLLGFERLGYDVYYVETHGRTPTMLMRSEGDDSAALAARLTATIMRRFGFAGRWAYHALHADRRCFGMSAEQLRRTLREADMLLNLHGGTMPIETMTQTDRLVYLETDPVQLQFELLGGLETTFEFLDAHCAHFTFAENYAARDCGLPVTDRYEFQPTRQPVVMDHWAAEQGPRHDRFTTVGNWRQRWREVSVGDELYTWSKDREFERFLDLPSAVGERFELALSSYTDDDRVMLERRGWRVADALDFSIDLHAYRRYVQESYGEFTAAKEQNVRLRTGWFSDRSATYLAAGRPVITQDTGFGNVLPTGEGLFPAASAEDAIAAVERIDADPAAARRAAREVAREYFSHDVVIGDILEYLGMGAPPRRGVTDRPRRPFSSELVVEPESRRPTRLPDETVQTVRRAPLPRKVPAAEEPDTSIVVVSYNTLVFTRMCLETVLLNTQEPPFELIVVDNASVDGSADYVRRLARRDARVRLIENAFNVGFPKACNIGLTHARGQHLVLLNSDTMVPPRWLPRLLAPIGRDKTALVGPVTNRIGNEAQIATDYQTWGGFVREARARAAAHVGDTFPVETLTMFCLAVHRDTHERLGGLDERFGLGTLEDDDYSMRARRAGCPLLCAEDVLVHHFGEASFGKLFCDGEYSRLLEDNRMRFAGKWDQEWKQYQRREDGDYDELVRRVRARLAASVPDGRALLVVTKGDERLVALDGVRARHFPADEAGGWAGYHPADSAQAISWLDEQRRRGARYLAVPATAFWWLDFYEDFARHLAQGHRELLRDDTCVLFALAET